MATTSSPRLRGRLLKQPWTLQDMEPVKREVMLSAIRVIDIIVDEVEGQSKINQHKLDVDHVAVANTLAKSKNSASRELAAKMRALRDHLTYEF
jgi:transcriptional regulator